MVNNKGQGLGNKPIIAILGLIAACITIFVFCTGQQNLIDLISNFTKIVDNQNKRLVTITPHVDKTLSEPTEFHTTSTLIAFEPITTPVVLESSNPGVSISLHDLSSNGEPGQGKVRIQFLTGSKPLRNVKIWFYKASQDITGNWTLVKSVTRNGGILVGGMTNENGILEESLDVGSYAIWNPDYTANWNQLNGNWGIKSYYLDYKDKLQTIIFPIQEGKLTNIKVSLSFLEIGVIDQGGNAIKNRLVYLFCQERDIANKKIPVDCGDGENVSKTDFTGLTSFNLGPGVYVIEVVHNGYEEDSYFFDIVINPGDERREILTLKN